MKYFFTLCCSLLVSAAFGQLIVNEVSNGPSGAQEFVELVVTGTPTCNTSTVDIRGWIFDDNNGEFRSGSGAGVASGHVRFTNDPQWAAVGMGSIILIYNTADKNTSITLPDDETDNNGDCVYILPVTSSLLEATVQLPSGSNLLYSPVTYGPSLNWTPLGLRNAGDSFQTRDPNNTAVPVQAVSYGDNSSNSIIYFPGSGGGSVYYMANTVDNDPNAQANWIQGVAGSPEETPGFANNPANAAWIATMNNNCTPVVNTPVDTTLNFTFCSGGSVLTPFGPIDTVGTIIDTFPNGAANGCDSILIVVVDSFATTTQQVSDSICNGEVFVFGTQNLTTPGVYTETFTAAQSGCDSTVELTLGLLQVVRVTIDTAICNRDSVLFGGVFIKTSGTYLDTSTTVFLCDSISTLNLMVRPTALTPLAETICAGSTFSFGGQTLSASGTYFDTLSAVNTCDSIVALTLTVLPAITSNETTGICSGESLTFGTQTITTAGVYTETFTSTVSSCDSTVTLTVTIDAFVTGNLNENICSGDNYVFAGQTLTTSGTYLDTTLRAGTCDSITILTLSVLSPSRSSVSRSICPGDSVFAGGAFQTTAGSYIDTITASNGCDSILTTNLSLDTPPVADAGIDQTICEGDLADLTAAGGNSYEWSTGDETIGTTVDPIINTEYIVTVTDAGGCTDVDTVLVSVTSFIMGIAVDPDTILPYGDVVELSATGDVAIGYSWSPNTALSDTTGAVVTAQPLDTITYQLVGDFGACSVTQFITIYVDEPNSLVNVPTAFSPNGDGMNDRFGVITDDVLIEVNELSVFNRWGQKVFSTADGLISNGWDGRFKGVNQPVGTYVWTMEFVNTITGETGSQSGVVMLFR